MDVTEEIKDIRDADRIEAEVFGLCKDNNRYCEIKDEDWDFGLCNLITLPTSTSCQVNAGDNHAGYIGSREVDNPYRLADIGAMDMVVGHWRNETASSS